MSHSGNLVGYNRKILVDFEHLLLETFVTISQPKWRGRSISKTSKQVSTGLKNTFFLWTRGLWRSAPTVLYLPVALPSLWSNL